MSVCASYTCPNCGTSFVRRSKDVVNDHPTCSRSCGNAYRTLDEQTRFWSQVRIAGPDDCWPWMSAIVRRYGHFAAREKSVKAHRYAYQITKGTIPKGQIVRHTCDNPPCCNPAHLIVGTHADNAKDRDSRGRGADRKGDKHPYRKIDSERLILIRRRLDRGEKLHSVAQEFGISVTQTSRIKNRKTWRSIPG